MMKLKHLHAENLRHLVPDWLVESQSFARELDQAFERFFNLNQSLKPVKWSDDVGFYVTVDLDNGDGQIAFHMDPPPSPIMNKRLTISCGDHAVSFPINEVLKGAWGLKGSHLVYMHTIVTEIPLSYIGITKNSWHHRWSQHQQSARSGSNLVFHKALREHAGKPLQHIVFVSHVDLDSAYGLEEEFVGCYSLYPLGLNMIPGGYAGLRYLSKLGAAKPKSAEDRDATLEAVAQRETAAGRPNPLCAARWVSDQEFVNRVICGHSGRLTVQQVRTIKLWHSFDKSPEQIAALLQVDPEKAKSVVAGKTYGRVV